MPTLPSDERFREEVPEVWSATVMTPPEPAHLPTITFTPDMIENVMLAAGL